MKLKITKDTFLARRSNNVCKIFLSLPFVLSLASQTSNSLIPPFLLFGFSECVSNCYDCSRIGRKRDEHKKEEKDRQQQANVLVARD